MMTTGPNQFFNFSIFSNLLGTTVGASPRTKRGFTVGPVMVKQEPTWYKDRKMLSIKAIFMISLP